MLLALLGIYIQYDCDASDGMVSVMTESLPISNRATDGVAISCASAAGTGLSLLPHDMSIHPIAMALANTFRLITRPIEGLMIDFMRDDMARYLI